MPSEADKSRFSRLLVVDDDANQVRTLTRILEDEGFDVVACSTGAEALEYLRGRDIGVAIVDLRLPDLTGTELLAKFETLRGLAQVIIHTAFGSFESARDAVNLGAFAYVEKGADPSELIQHVHRAFRTRLEEYATHLEAAVTERTRELQQTNGAFRKEAADRRRTEDAYRTLVDNSLQGLLMVQDERPVFANQAMAEILGCTIDEILAMSREDLRERIHPEDRERVWSNHHERLKGGTPPSQYEYRILRGNGEVRWLEIFASRTEINGRPAIQTAYIDITERKQAERALRESEVKFRELVELAPDSIVALDRWGRITACNRMTQTITGYSADELLGKRFTKIGCLKPQEISKYITVFVSILRGRIPEPIQLSLIKKDGTTFVGESCVSPIREHGRTIGLQIITRDVTEQKQAAEALAQSKNELAAVYDSAPVAIIVVDEDRRILRANRAARGARAGGDSDVVGLRGGEALRCVHSLDDPSGCGFGPACEACGVRNQVLDTLRTGNSHYREQHQVLVDGTGATVALDALVSCVPLPDGGRPRALVMVEDVTRQKQMEADMRQRIAELAHLGRLHTMGEMAGGLAHELNQPLYAIANYVTGITLRLREAEVDRQSLAEMMLKISGQARRASEIIKRLRNTVQKCEPRRSSTDLNELLRDVLPLVEHELRQENVSVQLDLQEGLPLVLADAVQIQQVALNLIRNAVDAMRDEPSRPRQLTLTTVATDGEAVEVRVGDSGKGLSEELRHQVFDAFFTKKANGLGMGLAISRTIVETHEGRIWVTPNTPHGCVFRFVIPTASKG